MCAGTATGFANITAAHKLTVADVKRAVRKLKVQNAQKIDGSFVAIIHPDVAFDLNNIGAFAV